MTQGYKIYVEVLATFKREGLLLPREIVWEDGRRFPVDKVLDLRPAAAQKAGGQGDRYTILVGGRLSFLFFEHVVDRLIVDGDVMLCDLL